MAKLSERLDAVIYVRLTRAERQKFHEEAANAKVSVQRLARAKLGLVDVGGYAYGSGKGGASGGDPGQEPLPEVPEHGEAAV